MTKHELRFPNPDNENDVYTVECDEQLFDRMMLGLEYSPLNTGGFGFFASFTTHFSKYNEDEDLYWMEVSLKREVDFQPGELEVFLQMLLRTGWRIVN